MAKFENNTGLNQVVIIGGGKKFVRKNGVIEARDDFIQVGFDKVPDDTPLTVRSTNSTIARSDDIQNIMSRLEDLEERFSNDETLSQIEEKIQIVSEKALTFDGDLKKDLFELRDLVSVLSETVQKQQNAVELLEQNRSTTNRRMEILKAAMHAMEFQIDEITGFSEEYEEDGHEEDGHEEDPLGN